MDDYEQGQEAQEQAAGEARTQETQEGQEAQEGDQERSWRDYTLGDLADLYRANDALMSEEDHERVCLQRKRLTDGLWNGAGTDSWALCLSFPRLPDGTLPAKIIVSQGDRATVVGMLTIGRVKLLQ